MRISLDDLLTNAIAVLRDSGDSSRMPSGVELDQQTATYMLDCAFELEELRSRVRGVLDAVGVDAGQGSKEEVLIALARVGLWDGAGSVSEIITVALATDRLGDLPRPYTDIESAWERLNARQKGIVRHHHPGNCPA